MCSHPSPPTTPSCTEHAAALQRALVEVTQECYFSFAEPCDPARFDKAESALAGHHPGEPVRWLQAEVGFDGAFTGRVALRLPYALAGELLMSFAGLMPGDPVPDDQVFDSTGEFVNMVCGTWLTRECRQRRFDLQPPVVRDVKGADRGEDGGQPMLINEQPVRLRLDLLAS